MAKTRCKGTGKDGQPCRRRGLDKYNGYCAAHGAPAARLDRRMPEPYKEMQDIILDCMNKVADGSLSPARCQAVCRGVNLKLDIYRLANETMDAIRREEAGQARYRT